MGAEAQGRNGSDAEPVPSTRNGRVSQADAKEFRGRIRLFQAARAGDAEAIKTLWERYHVRMGSVAEMAARQREEQAMTELVACPECGVKVKARGLGVHRARKHGAKRVAPHGPETAVARRPAPAPSAVRVSVEIVTDGITLPDVLTKIRQRIQECETALRVIAELTAAH